MGFQLLRPDMGASENHGALEWINGIYTPLNQGETSTEGGTEVPRMNGAQMEADVAGTDGWANID